MLIIYAPQEATVKKLRLSLSFINYEEKILICTHVTLRFAFDKLNIEDFADFLLTIDEFHHISTNIENSRLDSLLNNIMVKSNCHIVVMTGSYF